MDLIDVNSGLKSWNEISNDFILGLIKSLEWYGIIQSIHSNWKESILGNPINREDYNSVSRDGLFSLFINNYRKAYNFNVNKGGHYAEV